MQSYIDYKILKTGYSTIEENGTAKADCSISLIRSGTHKILVDTGGPWDKSYLLNCLEDLEIKPEDITFVIGTHGHSDHIGNLNLFPSAVICVSYDISLKDTYLVSKLGKGEAFTIGDGIDIIPTPGHTGADVSLVVRGTPDGTVVFAGDLFECEEDLKDPSIWQTNSEQPGLQAKHRESVLKLADYIVPGHGKIFKVPENLDFSV